MHSGQTPTLTSTFNSCRDYRSTRGRTAFGRLPPRSGCPSFKFSWQCVKNRKNPPKSNVVHCVSFSFEFFRWKRNSGGAPDSKRGRQFRLPRAPYPWGRVDPETKVTQLEVLDTQRKFFCKSTDGVQRSVLLYIDHLICINKLSKLWMKLNLKKLSGEALRAPTMYKLTTAFEENSIPNMFRGY